jgi:hypothetical protein
MSRFTQQGIGLVGLILALMGAGHARAELAQVEWLNRQCGLIIVKNSFGYTLAQHISPGMLTEGDMLVGDFAGGSRAQDVKNASTQSNLTLWLDQVFASKEQAFQYMPPHCRPEQ